MTVSDSVTIVDVAVGVIVQDDGKFLLTCRPRGKPYAGYWEFPGGKIEPGETSLSALNRELQEELGIQLLKAEPWITRNFKYVHAAVRLHFFRVTQWQGNPVARESQQLAWQYPRQITVSPMLPANTPILRALSLPSVYAITQASQIGAKAAVQQIKQALQHGLRLIQIREKAMNGTALQAFSKIVIELAHESGAQVLVNGDSTLCRELGADGIHLTASQLMDLFERPDMNYGWCGASCHNLEELHQAELLGIDFAVLGPVLPTLSHPATKPLGWRKFANLINDCSIPVYALGGLQPDDLSSAREMGAHGVAMIRGIDCL